MPQRKNILAIIGSASEDSANEKLVQYISRITKEELAINVFNGLKNLPHFDPKLSISKPPEVIEQLREEIKNADGILICTPEYVFSIPSGLKNMIEWCVSTTVFSEKPSGLITASAQGEKGHEELQLIMQTVMARFTKETSLLIQGIKGKLNEQGEITDTKTQQEVHTFSKAFTELVLKARSNTSI